MATVREEIERGDRARRLLEDETFQSAFEQVRQAILHGIESCPLRDTEGAEKLRIELKLLRDLRANFEQAVNDGKLADFRLKEEQRIANLSDFKHRGSYGR